MKKLRAFTVKQWAELRALVLAKTTEDARERAQERFEATRMRHKDAGNPVPDPIGCWREELQCQACGHIDIVGVRYLAPSICTSEIKPGPKCKGVFHGRPRNRCGWPTSRAWIFVPDNPL